MQTALNKTVSPTKPPAKPANSRDRKVQKDAINSLIAKARRDRNDDGELAEAAVELAAELLDTSLSVQTWSEKWQGKKLAGMMVDEAGKAFTLAMADQVFRPPSLKRAGSQFRYLVDHHGVPQYLPFHERLGLSAARHASLFFPKLVMSAVTGTVRRESNDVILPAEDGRLKPHLAKRREAGVRMNINQLGEAILGEHEAEHRIQDVLNNLADPEINYISVKISSIFSQIHLIGFEDTLEKIKERVRRLYRAAIENSIDGKKKFVNLDMEEYRDLQLTCEVFQQVLDEPEFLNLEAGIVLQAYLPDSWGVQKELNAWAIRRKERGGAGIKIRIVKGANLAMESVDAELHDWAQAPYLSKEEVDANFKRMLHEACKPEVAAAVRLGVGSHNLFDIAYALLLREREGVTERIEFEMLEGMANHQARAVKKAASGLLLYAPIVRRDDFSSAIAYLVRRLDENTAPDNFLRDIFAIRVGNEVWEDQKKRFLAACGRKDTIASTRSRRQNRAAEMYEAVEAEDHFENVPDTDWALRENSHWIRKKVEEFEKSEIEKVPLVINGREVAGKTEDEVADPSRPGKRAYTHAMAGAEQIEEALDCSEKARDGWIALGFEKRAELLREAAVEISKIRGEAVATMVMDAGKAILEGDVEVSEAIDFANYYAQRPEADGAELEPFGTVLVTPPWNFPFAIPCGSVLAALIAGNTVILKPAPETVLTAWVMVQALWRAGIPRDVLQFVPAPDDDLGKSMVVDDRIGAIVLTGGHETAQMFLDWKPGLRLFAETSGKSALIITAAADIDVAVKDLVKSAFGQSGQKCSAASLGIIEAGIYDSPGFRRQLKDAAASLQVGPSWDFSSFATPVIRDPSDPLKRALTSLEPGEEWLLEPKMIDNNPCLWSPGIKLGIKRDSWYRRNECFGPVLGLIRAENFEDAMSIQNDSEFGLTGGIHSLDDREIEIWKEKVEVGNAYINRPITGAIVQRQPFGGWKRSYFGPGAKAGGPNYVPQFGTWINQALPEKSAPAAFPMLSKLKKALPEEAEALEKLAQSDAYWETEEFEIEHDPTGLRCEANIFRYRPFDHAWIRIGDEITDRDAARMVLAAEAAGMPYELTSQSQRAWFADLGLKVTIETDEECAKRFTERPRVAELLRAPDASPVLKREANLAGMRVARGPVVWDGRWEMPAWYREQAVTETLHRYGNLLPKAQGRK